MAKVNRPLMRVDRRATGNQHGSMTPRVLVIHSTESHDRYGLTDVVGVLRYLEEHEDELGVHFVIDKDGNIGRGGYIHARNLMYHCKGANDFSVGIELVGFARFTLTAWLTRRRQLRALAWLMAWLSQELNIPLRTSTARGVALHRDFPAGGHTDPGRFFPRRRVLRMARWNVRRAAEGKTYGWNTPLNP